MSLLTGFRPLSRRRFVGVSLAAGAGVLMGGAGALWALRGRAPRIVGLRCLSDHQYRTLQALATALFPRGGVIPVGAADLDLPRLFDAYLADEPAYNAADLKRAIFALEYGPVLFDHRLVTFSNLPDAERLAHFESWSTAPSLERRQAAMAFRKFLSLVFYDNPAVWPYLGYEGPLYRKEATA